MLRRQSLVLEGRCASLTWERSYPFVMSKWQRLLLSKQWSSFERKHWQLFTNMWLLCFLQSLSDNLSMGADGDAGANPQELVSAHSSSWFIPSQSSHSYWQPCASPPFSGPGGRHVRLHSRSIGWTYAAPWWRHPSAVQGQWQLVAGLPPGWQEGILSGFLCGRSQ